MKKTTKLFGIIALVAVFGLAIAACGDEDPSDGPPGGGGTFTLTGIPAEYNGRQAGLMAYLNDEDEEWLQGSAGISNGRVSIPVRYYNVMNFNFLGSGYSGNDRVDVLITILNPNATSDNYTEAFLTFESVRFSNGNATKSWNEGDLERLGPGGGPGGGGNPPSGTNPSITIVNNTGVSIPYGYIKPSTATNWSADRLTSTLANGSSQTITLPQTIAENNKYDFMLRTATSGGTVFRKYSVTVTNGSTVTITNADISDGSELSTVYLRNRIGKNFDGFYYKSSSSSDWGANFGTITYNSQDNTSLLVSVHPSVNTVFDFQLRTSNPTNTYTKRNVTVTHGMTLTFTSADSDTPLTGNPVIVIQNNTSDLIVDVWISPVDESTWGNDLLFINLARGGSYAFTLTAPLSVRDRYDVRICGMFIGSDNYYKMNVTVTEGMILTFTDADHQ